MLRAPWLSGPWLNPVDGERNLQAEKPKRSGMMVPAFVEVEQGSPVAVSLFFWSFLL